MRSRRNQPNVTEFAELRREAGLTLAETATLFGLPLKTIETYEQFPAARASPRALQALKGLVLARKQKSSGSANAQI